MIKLNNKYLSSAVISVAMCCVLASTGITQLTFAATPDETSKINTESIKKTSDAKPDETTKETPSTTNAKNNTPTTEASNYPTLTDDQVAMSIDELLNDPDLLRPITKGSTINYNESESEAFDDDEEFSAPEEINFDDDFEVPEYAQKLLDKSYPDYHPPTGKLFGFMRRHLLQRGDSPKPWTVEDDFNGDQRPDWAALMVNKGNQLDVIVIYSEDENYRLEVLFEDAGTDNDSIKIAISQEKPGDKIGASYKNKPGKYRTASLEFPGINIMYYTKSSSLFFWSNYYFDELLTSK
jgi:hypothetical protein